MIWIIWAGVCTCGGQEIDDRQMHVADAVSVTAARAYDERQLRSCRKNGLRSLLRMGRLDAVDLQNFIIHFEKAIEHRVVIDVRDDAVSLAPNILLQANAAGPTRLLCDRAHRARRRHRQKSAADVAVGSTSRTILLA